MFLDGNILANKRDLGPESNRSGTTMIEDRAPLLSAWLIEEHAESFIVKGAPGHAQMDGIPR